MELGILIGRGSVKCKMRTTILDNAFLIDDFIGNLSILFILFILITIDVLNRGLPNEFKAELFSKSLRFLILSVCSPIEFINLWILLMELLKHTLHHSSGYAFSSVSRINTDDNTSTAIEIIIGLNKPDIVKESISSFNMTIDAVLISDSSLIRTIN